MLFSKNNKLEDLYYTYRNLMFAEAYRILRDKSLSEDAVSESFVRIMKNVHKINLIDTPHTRNFFVVICRNVAIDIYNKQKKEYSICEEYKIAENINPEKIVIDNESVDKIIDIIANMESIYKDVLILSRVYKMKRNDIAELLCIMPESVTKRLQRAKAKIKEELRKEDV